MKLDLDRRTCVALNISVVAFSTASTMLSATSANPPDSPCSACSAAKASAASLSSVRMLEACYQKQFTGEFFDLK